MNTKTIITIDGPAGTGKSAVAAGLARRLALPYLDTGAMYRAATLAALEQHLDLEDRDALTRLVEHCRIDLDVQPGRYAIRLDDRDVTDAIRHPRVTDHAHYLARDPQVRECLVRQQRQIGCRLGSLVTEGRDQGTVVFPHADFKFYLDASPECRAKRRLNQLHQKGMAADYDQILAAQRQRDQRDAARAVGPLKPAPDAIVIDTSKLTLEQVIDTLYRRITQKSPPLDHNRNTAPE